METETPATRAQLLIIHWVLWGAFMVGVVMIYHFLGTRTPPAPDGSRQWMLALAPLVISLIVRWTVIPRITVVTSVLPAMIAGIALAEMVLFLGIFIFPQHQFDLFLAALFGVA